MLLCVVVSVISAMEQEDLSYWSEVFGDNGEYVLQRCLPGKWEEATYEINENGKDTYLEMTHKLKMAIFNRRLCKNKKSKISEESDLSESDSYYSSESSYSSCEESSESSLENEDVGALIAPPPSPVSPIERPSKKKKWWKRSRWLKCFPE